MITVSVTDIDCYRLWRDDEELDFQWLLKRLYSREQTEAMKVGAAFHAALEDVSSDTDSLTAGGYRFDLLCDFEMRIPQMRELPIRKEYGKLQVRGRLDALSGKVVTDYKSTFRFDADRLLEGYQWRFYLDMTGANVFRWEVFVLRETDDPRVYCVVDTHTLEQKRYPGLTADCARLAEDYYAFALENLARPDPMKDLEITDRDAEVFTGRGAE